MEGQKANGFAPPTKPFQQSPVPTVYNNARQQRQNMGRMNGPTNSQEKVQTGIYIPQLKVFSVNGLFRRVKYSAESLPKVVLVPFPPLIGRKQEI